MNIFQKLLYKIYTPTLEKAEVRWSDDHDLYYVSTGLVSLQVGWMSEKRTNTKEIRSGEKPQLYQYIFFDGDQYARKLLDFRMWKVKTRANREEQLFWSEPAVRDYIEVAIVYKGWYPIHYTDTELRPDQILDSKMLEKTIRKEYGYRWDNKIDQWIQE